MTQKTFHEYDFPDDRSVHWHALTAELREGANTTRAFNDVTCAGCRGWELACGEYRDAVHVHVHARFGAWERFKILLGGEVHLHVETRTENEVGRVLTPPVAAHVARPYWWPREQLGGAVAERTERRP